MQVLEKGWLIYFCCHLSWQHQLIFKELIPVYLNEARICTYATAETEEKNLLAYDSPDLSRTERLRVKATK
jgi:hypothetical protein